LRRALWQKVGDDPDDPILARWALCPTALWTTGTVIYEIGMTRRRARRALKRLEKRGLIRPWSGLSPGTIARIRAIKEALS